MMSQLAAGTRSGKPRFTVLQGVAATPKNVCVTVQYSSHARLLERRCLSTESDRVECSVMEHSFSCAFGYFVSILLLQMVLTSEQFTVSSPRRHQVVMLGTHAELSCQLSPRQSAEHMQVGWYRDHYQPISVYKKGEELSGKSIQNYMNHTMILKDALGEGKMTLRIHNVSVFDAGQYHCFFKDDDTTEEATVDLKVAAVGVDIQINVEIPDTKGLVVECNSGGWFPQPRMEWRDSRGNVIPASSKVFSEDGNGLLHLKMSVLLETSTHGPVTCCLLNPVTQQEKRAGIVLPDILIKLEYMSTITCINSWLLIYLFIMHVLLYFRSKVVQDKCPVLFEILFEWLPFLTHASIFPIYWKLWNRGSVLEGLAPLYNTWMCDISVVVSTLITFFTILIFYLFYTLKGK
ncbi:selection and upkeep of intraepithelial T-cells protein 1-like [Pteronotus mesoamericanus]|uniref:selection and upkeep of intraepithelial T-cells protein 1-like n=1 Tax=Pteronotus mesoamericanus TaxID=1884717 RepID=UPI0023EBA48F|nr:selection and upkeep of intraepithelial T-cells protein 1-like [Pteronotus parnellii mesoamericanus]